MIRKEKKFYRSLSLRILFLTFFFVLLPFLAHSFFLLARFRQATIDSALSGLTVALQYDLRLFDDWRRETFAMPPPESETFFLTPSSPFASLFTEDIRSKTHNSIPFAFASFSPHEKKEPLLILAQNQNENLRVVAIELKALDLIFPKTTEQHATFLATKETSVWSNSSSVFTIFTPAEIKQWRTHDHLLDLLTFKKKNIALSSSIVQSNLFLGVGLPSSSVSWDHFSPFKHLLHFLSFLILCGLLFSFLFLRKMIAPVQQLSHVMRLAAQGDTKARYKKERFGFEINLLGNQLNQMFKTVYDHLRIAQEVALASDLQQALLPKTLPHIEGIEIGYSCVAATEIAGDFYDLYPFSPSSLFLTIADTAGKGVSACLYSLIVRSVLRGEISGLEHQQKTTKEKLEMALRKTNALFCKDTGDSGNFTTLWSGIYKGKEEKLYYNCSGHLPAFLIDDQGYIQELSTKGCAFGVTHPIEIEIKEIAFPRGAILFLYTDGVIEAENAEGDFFGKKRLYALLKKHAQTLSAQDLVTLVLEEVAAFCFPKFHEDDITMVCIKSLV